VDSHSQFQRIPQKGVRWPPWWCPCPWSSTASAVYSAWEPIRSLMGCCHRSSVMLFDRWLGTGLGSTRACPHTTVLAHYCAGTLLCWHTAMVHINWNKDKYYPSAHIFGSPAWSLCDHVASIVIR
jgi:hypothetical protein